MPKHVSHIGGYRDSFFLHLRPRQYLFSTIGLQNTWYLGFFSVFFLIVECITGAVLMVYYAPTPAEAYSSVIRLATEVPFGWLLRDIHRLAGELMIVAVTLHMLRVMLAGAFHGIRVFTWITGVLLYLCTLVLAFTGYLLPWDQLAYWAVTIGTSIIDTIPVIGHQLTLILRGGTYFEGDGLLRFYLLHIMIVPASTFILMAIHYYRVVRLHGIIHGDQKPPENINNSKPLRDRLPFFPAIPLQEFCLSATTLIILIIVATFFYEAPLQQHANPLHTPTDTRAPWFFLWLQGGLKLGNSFIMGICFPILIVLLLLGLPYLVKGDLSLKKNRRVFRVGLTTAVSGLFALTLIGLPQHGLHPNPIARIFTTLAPEEPPSPFHAIGYDDLPQGVYTTEQQIPANIPKHFQMILEEYRNTVETLARTEDYLTPQGIIIIEDYQANLKRITLRIHWQNDDKPQQPLSSERQIYLYRPETASAQINNQGK